MSEVVELFQQLEAPAGCDDRTFSAHQLSKTLLVAKGSAGRPALLVAEPPSNRAPIVTRHLRADFGAPCDVVLDGQLARRTLAVVECSSADADVQRHFLLAATAALGADDSDADSDAHRVLEALIETFRAMSSPPMSSVAGIWGELALMTTAVDPATLLDAWHATPADRHDFVRDGDRIEVKTTTNRARRHRFSHDQLRSDDERLAVISLHAESSASGQSIEDLVGGLSRRLDGERRLRMLIGVSTALGQDWLQAHRHRYDVATAIRSARVVDSRTLPTLPEPIDEAISDIRYTIDFAGLPYTTLERPQRQTPLWEALKPR